MCLGIPMKIKEIHGKLGIAELSGIEREVALDFVPDAKPGDWVIIHAGYAIQIMDEKDAIETLRLLEEAFGVSGEIQGQ